MEVILKQDIEKLGFMHDTITVKDGYARNYLIPRGMAVIANPTNRKVVAEIQRQQSFKEEKVKTQAETIAGGLKDMKLRIPAKAGTSGKIFGSVNAVQIANAIKEDRNIEIDRKKIVMNADAIKELGTYKAKIRLHKEVVVELEFEVFAE
jgi:large subunit ribosomal protein L9